MTLKEKRILARKIHAGDFNKPLNAVKCDTKDGTVILMYPKPSERKSCA